jgi:hypothetical protein
MFFNFNNRNNATVQGVSNISGNLLNYSYLYVKNNSENNGPISGYVSFIDLSYTGADAIKIDNYHNNSTNIGSNVLFYIDTTVLNNFFYILNSCTDIGEQVGTIFLKEGESIELQAEHFNGKDYLNCVPGVVSKCVCPGRVINTNGSPNVTWEWRETGSADILSSTNRLMLTAPTTNEYAVTFNINGARLAGPPIRIVILSNNYDVPKKKLDAGFYQMYDGRYYFKFIEEYTKQSANLKYKVYEENYTLISGTTPSQVESVGDNRYSVNLTSSSLTVGSYYIVEIFNEKNERWISRIKYKQ